MSKINRRQFVKTATTTAAMLALASCAPAAPAPTQAPVATTQAPAVKKLRQLGLQLPWRKNGESAAFFVAQEAGYFTQEGLDVSFIEGGPGIPAHINILSGTQGIEYGCFASDGAMIPLLAGEPPLPFVMTGALLQEHPLGFVILENKLTPEQRARELIPQDLKGKTIGVQGEPELLALLAKNGMSRSDVKDIVIIAGENPADLLTQRVDFASYWVVNQPLTLNEPWKALKFSQWGVPFYGDVILTTRERLKKEPELMKAFWRALKKAMQKTLDDPDFAIKVVLKTGGAETEAILKKRIPLQNSMMQGSDTKTHGLGWMDPTRVAQSVKFYVDSKQIKATLKVEDIMTTEYL